VPDDNILELYDVPEELGALELEACLIRALDLPAKAAGVLHVDIDRAAPFVSLVAFLRPSYASRLIAAAPLQCGLDAAASVQVRALQHATAASKVRLRQLRGDEFRPKADPSAARRLIHGCLQSQIPLPHLMEEKIRQLGGGRGGAAVTQVSGE